MSQSERDRLATLVHGLRGQPSNHRHTESFRKQVLSYPGLRGGRVVMEQRRDGSLAIPFGDRYLKYREVSDAAKEISTSEASGEAKAGSPSQQPAANHPWRVPYKRVQ